LHSTDEDKLARLMTAAVDGDETAYAEFLRCAGAIIRGFARRKLAEGAVVGPEDIVQETLLAIHAKRHTWRRSEPILPWIFTITRYKVVDVFRRNGKRIFVDVETFAEELAAPEPTEPVLGERQMQAALGSLSEGQRRVVHAIAVEGRTIPETAAAFNMKEPAVRVAFHRGLAALAARFGRQT